MTKNNHVMYVKRYVLGQGVITTMFSSDNDRRCRRNDLPMFLLLYDLILNCSDIVVIFSFY